VLRNSAFVVDASGLRAVYRKVHLWDREASFFVPGTEPPAVVDTDVGRIGVCVCYDLEFPEWTRTAALAGVDVLCAPTNWPSSWRPSGERPAEVVRAQATASVDRVFVAVCDRVGRERGVDWIGGSAIVDPNGYPLALSSLDDTVQTLMARCRLSDARSKGTSAVNGVVADRRPDLYGAVTRPLR
jgi:predicted amidohydrolase